MVKYDQVFLKTWSRDNNVLIRKRKEMNKNMTLKRKSKFKRLEEIKISFSRKTFTPRKTDPHQMKMKSATVIQKGTIHGNRIL